MVAFPSRRVAALHVRLHDAMGPVLALQFGMFAAFGVLAAVCEQRMFVALRRHEPGAAAPDDAVLDALGEKPSAFVPIMARATGARLAVLIHRSPYPDVESRRRIAVAAVLLALLSVAWSVFAPGR
jgi:hypothetical protein